MTWLIDTNVISEVRKGAGCNPTVAAWWQGVEDRDLYLSVLTLGEIRKGVEAVRPRDPAKANKLAEWLADVVDAFGARVLTIDEAVAETWGRMSATRSVPVIDTLLAATAQVHGLVFVTRNTADVGDLGVRLLNPFESQAT